MCPKLHEALKLSGDVKDEDPFRMQPLQLVINNLAPHQNREVYSSFQAHVVQPVIVPVHPVVPTPEGSLLPHPQQHQHQKMSMLEEGQQQVLIAIEDELDWMYKQQRAACVQVNEQGEALAYLMTEHTKLLEEMRTLKAAS
ncbi:hypothetical protein CEUSTIGMA_g1319.t1 [Chlamydomonas eustigma]|uniref:Uncharacterized protein n=1 Tax=Chlamydomonas eustigma TaxID=1157962 RepID=A0A250WT32_9CHLO|nr:hypothetical protein CEUSTIGMA_g1319.t1 [Chlamydomonas eustigma]|eukprot:GAX73869.1 hypothetical protein CEUSTIGMA_g1319.t1 [Chlamydomonas eustigma]